MTHNKGVMKLRDYYLLNLKKLNEIKLVYLQEIILRSSTFKH